MTVNRGFRKSSGPASARGDAAGVLPAHQIQGLVKVEFDRARRYGYPLTVLVFRLDRIDAIANLHGLSVRDDLIGAVAKIVRRDARSSDVLGRHGSEALILLMPHTVEAGALVLAERARKKVTELQLQAGGGEVALTVSIGIAEYAARNALFCDAVVAVAERAMEEARRKGGDRVEVGAVEAAAPAAPPESERKTPPPDSAPPT